MYNRNMIITEKPKKIIYTALSIMLAVVMLPQVSFAAPQDKILQSLQQSGTIGEINKIDISLPKVKKTHNYLVINDSHIITESKELTDQKTIASRITSFSEKSGKASKDTFPELMKRADSLKLDAIILNGDII